jgi:hypothetical protein
MHVEQPRADHLERVRVGDLRDEDRIGRGLYGGIEVVDRPGCLEPVDAYEHFARAEPARLDGLDHLIARGLLGLGRHRVLEIEDDAVDRQPARLLDGASIAAGHVEHAAARTHGHAAKLPAESVST